MSERTSGATVIRDARSNELDELARMVVAQPLLQRYGATAEGLARQMHEALARGEIILTAGEGFAWFLPTGTFAVGAYLRLIALAPGREGAGLGGALLDEIERRVAPRPLFLLVSDFNTGAQRFYERRGYTRVGTLPAFVRPDADECVYYKKLAL